MATQTSLVAQQVRIRQWAEQIRNCQNRPEYSCAVTPQVRQMGNRLSGLAGTAYASLLA